MNQPRKHHYVPKFMLAGFTRQGTASGELHVVDLKRRQLRRSTPLNEGHARDHFRVDADDPFAVEKTVDRTVEGPAAAVLSEIIQRGQLPHEPEKRGALMSLIAMLAVRVRPRRKQAQDFFADAAAMLENLTASKYEIYRSQVVAAGMEAPSQADYEEHVQYLRSKDRARWTPDRTTLVMQELQLSATIFPLLWDRHWCLAVTREPGVEFVCSDSPVVLMDPNEDGLAGPGFGLRSTSVMVPLWRGGLLVGTWGQCQPLVVVGREQVADFNMMTIANAHEFVWAPWRRFHYRWSQGQLLRDPKKLLADRGDLRDTEDDE